MNRKPSYYQQRTLPLGITEENNKIALWQNDINNKDSHEPILVEVPIFREVPEGIEILVYTLDRYPIRIEKNGNRWKKDFTIQRLEKPIVKPDGSIMKYKLPKGAGTHPFFPPPLVEKYDNQTNIDTLFLGEGYFKAFKASNDGLDIIGLSSITHMKDKDTGALHPGIVQIILTCNVKRIVWLTDGDALDITQKEITDGLDLSKRPKQFFASVQTFKTLLDDYDIDKWFIHIDTDAILDHNKGIQRDQVKGIDDLLITFEKSRTEIIKDLTTVSSQSIYFQKFNITFGLSKVYNHFRLRDVKEFYLFHVDRRPELKDKEFIFNGTRYQYDEEKGDCLVRVPGDAKLYFRVGDNYYKKISVPNQYKQIENTFHARQKGTIKDDHGPAFQKHIPKYEAFCNVPDHYNFQPVINNCFNVYSPLDFIPDDEDCTETDCTTIINLFKHLFGQNAVSYKDMDANEIREYRMIELALDYMQILYQQPWQKLPILCLVSKENNTGKTTLGNFLRMMLGSNVAIVGNADLQNDFNAHWATKSIVICDETKIDKQHVVEKIKSLSTAKKIYMNAKGRDQVELDCFIKFILITNNEDNFINASNEDIRYWIIKVPKLEKENPDILNLFKEEMPAFLSFLNKRKLVTDKKNRMWFHPDLLKTDALKKVIDNSRPSAEKEMRHYLKELFLDNPDFETIEMPLLDIQKEIFKGSGKYDGPYLKNILQEKMNVFPYHVWVIENNEKEFKNYDECVSSAKKMLPGIELEIVLSKICKKFKTKRYKYPKRTDDNEKPIIIINPVNAGRPYCFHRKDLVNHEDEIKDHEDQIISTFTVNGRGLIETKEEDYF